MSEWSGVVWIVECDHEPLIVNGQPVSFPCGGEGTNAVRWFLNTLPTDGEHYYDAVLYESRARQKIS